MLVLKSIFKYQILCGEYKDALLYNTEGIDKMWGKWIFKKNTYFQDYA